MMVNLIDFIKQDVAVATLLITIVFGLTSGLFIIAGFAWRWHKSAPAISGLRIGPGWWFSETRSLQFMTRCKEPVAIMAIKMYRRGNYRWIPMQNGGTYGIIMKPNEKITSIRNGSEYQIGFPATDHPDGKYKCVIELDGRNIVETFDPAKLPKV